jgi:hypothetical protein
MHLHLRWYIKRNMIFLRRSLVSLDLGETTYNLRESKIYFETAAGYYGLGLWCTIIFF